MEGVNLVGTGLRLASIRTTVAT